MTTHPTDEQRHLAASVPANRYPCAAMDCSEKAAAVALVRWPGGVGMYGYCTRHLTEQVGSAPAPAYRENIEWLHAPDDTTPDNWTMASKNARLGVDHDWTNVRCPAYRTLAGVDCTCGPA